MLVPEQHKGELRECMSGHESLRMGHGTHGGGAMRRVLARGHVSCRAMPPALCRMHWAAAGRLQQ